MCSIFVARPFNGSQNLALVKSFSSEKSSPTVCGNDKKSFTVSYLINSCGLSSKDAIAASNKLCFKSSEKPDAVLKLLRDYGFTDAHIPRLVIKLPSVLVASPSKTLLPKLEFLLSIGVPLPVLAQKLSQHPYVLMRSLENAIVPLYNYLKNLLQSDERVVKVFTRAPKAFGCYLPEGIDSNISVLKERGWTQSYIVTLLRYEPALLLTSKEKIAGYVDRAVEMGFDVSKVAFFHAIKVMFNLTETTLKHKMEVYRRCGWSESDIISAFLRHPSCMTASEEKIMDIMEFLVNTMGCKPATVAQCPAFLSFSLDNRIKPRCLVAKILEWKGIKNITSLTTLLMLSEKKFLMNYIVKYQKDVPELLDIYQGKLSPPEMDIVQDK